MVTWQYDINFKCQMLKCEWRDTQKALAKAFILAATKQLYEWFSPPVRPSYPFHYVPIITSSWNFQELLPLTDVMPLQKAKATGQRSRSQIKTQFERFRTVTPVWNHI